MMWWTEGCTWCGADAAVGVSESVVASIALVLIKLANSGATIGEAAGSGVRAGVAVGGVENVVDVVFRDDAPTEGGVAVKGFEITVSPALFGGGGGDFVGDFDVDDVDVIARFVE